jgi:hypothetical protein
MVYSTEDAPEQWPTKWPFKTPEQVEEDSYCDSTPIGEKWPICNKQKGHNGDHESADFTWPDGGIAVMKVP